MTSSDAHKKQRPFLGLIALGQKPRPDFEREVKKYLPSCAYQVAGALDELSEKQIEALASTPGEYLLRVPAAGRFWEIPRDALIPFLEKTEKKLKAEGAFITILMCAGMFPPIASSGIMLYPGSLLLDMFKGIRYSSSPMTIGLILPNEAQMPFAFPPWEEAGFSVVTGWASPDNHEALLQTALNMQSKADVIILNCLGFNSQHLELLHKKVRTPVITPLQVVLNAVSFLVPEQLQLCRLTA